MKRILSVTALVLSLTAGSSAAVDDIKRTMVEEILTLTKAEDNLANARDQFLEMMSTQFQTIDVPEEFRERFNKHMNKMMEMALDEMSWKVMKKEYVEMYSDIFTQEELGGLIVFYRSPTGQALIGKLPELTARMMQVTQERMQRLMPRVMSMTEDFVAEMQEDDEEASDDE